MTDPDDLRFAAQLGPRQFKETHDALTTREKLDAAREERTRLAEKATKLREQRRRELVDGGYFVDESIRETSAETEGDLEDFNAAIAELEQKLADEEAAAKLQADQTAAAAEAERRAEQKQARTDASSNVDQALVQLEVAVKAWIESQRDLPVVQQNRRPFYLQAAITKLAPELAKLLKVQRVPHSHQRPLAEVAL